MTETAMTAYEIEDRLEQIAPHPQEGTVTAAGFASYLATRAQLGFARNVTPFIRDDQEVSSSLILAFFAAEHALIALAEHAGQDVADECARRITDAWVDGNCLGAYLHEDLVFLLVDPDEVSRLDEARLRLEDPAWTPQGRLLPDPGDGPCCTGCGPGCGCGSPHGETRGRGDEGTSA